MAAGYLLDTNVVSETRKRRADERVIGFLATTESARLFLSALTLGELRKGVAAKFVEAPSAAAELAVWVDTIETTFADRVLPIDAAVARLWGELSARRKLPVIDTLIAATALAYDLVLVTRNLRDIAGTGVEALNPWRPE